MKIAICIVGQYRQFDYTFPLWNINSMYQVDYYVSTWDISSELKKYTYDNIDKPVFTENHPNGLVLNHEKKDFFKKINIDTILDKLPNAKIKITNHIYQSESFFTNTIFHMKNCINMIDKKIYDYIFIVRFDEIVIIKDLNNLNKDTLYFSGFYSVPNDKTQIENFHIDDLFWIGDDAIIKKFINEMPSTLYHPHCQTAYYIHENKIKILENKDKDVFFITMPMKPSVIPFLIKMKNDNINLFLNSNCSLCSELYKILCRQNKIGNKDF